MLQRRTVIGAGAILIATSGRAQRPANPIARPPGRRPGGLIPGRFEAEGGVASGVLPGVFVVVSVDAKSDMLQLRDEGGRSRAVHVNERMLDLETLKPGDEVEVDFLVPEPGATRLEAGTLWKVER